MLHARSDWNGRIVDLAALDPANWPAVEHPIGADEPVFLVRARDLFAPLVPEFYAAECFRSGRVEHRAEMMGATNRHAMLMRQWQATHGAKLPDAPLEALT